MDARRWRDEQRSLRAAIGRRRRAALGPRARSPAQPAEPLVSVVVVCWNAADVIGRCIEHLLAQEYENREIVVVDDGSDDGTYDVAKRAAEPTALTLVRSARNRGCPAARNLGIRHASGEIVAFIDADGFADRAWLTHLVAAFGADRRVGAVASTVFYDDNPIVLNGAGGTVNRQGWAADLAINESFELAELAADALYPMGCGMAVRREALERVGPFDEGMLNYYDDVDYGVRLWRAGYSVQVAADAWIDHAAAAGDSTHKRLLCERHRMRVVLKHAPARRLTRWATQELRAMRRATSDVRVRKLRAYMWNALRLPRVLAARRLMRGAPPAPARLIDDSWGDAFPVGVVQRCVPVPEHARASVVMSDPHASDQLVVGWFPAETAAGRSRRWAGAHAVALLRLERAASKLRIEYAQPPVDIGGVDVALRKVGAEDPSAAVWGTHLRWSYTDRAVENHPVALAPGDYEVAFDARRTWSDPPRETRALGFALTELSLSDTFELDADGGLWMEHAAAEQQLVRGWYEPEQSAARHYRWAGLRAEAVVHLGERARPARVVYRTAPGETGPLALAVLPFDGGSPVCLAQLDPADDWRETSLAVDLAPGCYVVSFEVERTWSNPDGRQAGAAAERRALGFALSSVGFGEPTDRPDRTSGRPRPGRPG
jgi:GT2 family glycosyltransferase